MALADAKAPVKPEAAALLASDFKSTNFGSAVAASTPKITITITNSIRVKPPWFCFIVVTF